MLIRSLLERYYLEKFMLEVSIATLEHGGVTSNLRTQQFLAPIDAWGLPRHPERTLILPPEADIFQELSCFVYANTGYLYAPGSWLGTWINPSTHCCHLDITEICPTLEEARAQALWRNAHSSCTIIAIYNFKKKETIYLHDEEEHISSQQLPDFAITQAKNRVPQAF